MNHNRGETEGASGWTSWLFARAALIALAVWLGLLLLWSANTLVFVVFLGVLFGLAVARGVDRMEGFGVRRGVASALIVFGVVGAVVGSGVLMAPTLVAQAQELRKSLPASMEKAQEFINKREFGFLDPFLQAPSDSLVDLAAIVAADSVIAARAKADSIRRDSLRRDSVQRANARRVIPKAPKLPDSSTMMAISKQIDDSLRARMPKVPGVDTILFTPAAPLARAPVVDDTIETSVGVIGDTTTALMEIDVDRRLEERTQFLRDSIRRALRARIDESDQRAREEAVAAGDLVSPDGPTRSQMLTRRLTTGIAGSSRQLFSLLTGTIAALGGLLLVMFLAIYIGAEPKVYERWILSAVPAERRVAALSVMSGMSAVLRKWLVTQVVAMVVIGVVSTVTFLLLGVRAAFALGLIAAFLEFVPTVGPILAAVPAVAMGFVDSPQKALAVLIACFVIQFVENNLLIPALMRGEIDLPPALTLIAQALMALLFGFIGLMVAVPLLAAVLVPLRMYAANQDAKESSLIINEPAPT